MKRGWRQAPLRRVLVRRRDTNEGRTARLLSLTIDGATVPRSGAEGLGAQAPSESSISSYALVDPGELVVNPMWLVGGSIGVATMAGAVSPAYRVYTPQVAMSPRFLHHAVRSEQNRAAYRMLGRGETTFDRAVSAQDFESLPIAWPDIEEQHRIADFLDDRVARIDQIITARERQASYLDAALDSEWYEAGEQIAMDKPVVALRRVLRSIVDGPFGSSLTSSHYTDSGVRVVRLGNIGVGYFKDQDAAFISDDYGQELAGHAVQAGDILMAGLGDDRWPLGRCALAPQRLGRAIVKADCYRIRLDERVNHDYAVKFLSGPQARSAFRVLSRGSTRARLNTDLARAAQVPLASLPEQHAYVARVDTAMDARDSRHRHLEASIGLLREYKQSLITAAVTGEIDVTTAVSGIPG